MSHTSHMSPLSHCISNIFKLSEKKERKNNLPLLDLLASPQVKINEINVKKLANLVCCITYFLPAAKPTGLVEANCSFFLSSSSVHTFKEGLSV